ncbi:TPA: flagellar hook-length control protein FliK [Legionella pneumophila]|nr:flagellar hook-length control protein FliK [Legionella pneumophila]HAT8183216.1 flagellar hook-length control protein FliK [Legionella pneumophila]
MSVEMSKTSSTRIPPGQEIKLAKPATELYVGQILKTVVVTTLSNDQVLININGQNLNAKASHHFTPGELFEVKVIANHPETILEVQQKTPFPSLLQNALLQYLPKQAPATNFLQTLTQLMTENNLSVPINQVMKTILGNIPVLNQLPNQLMQAISQSGVFLESKLLKGRTQQEIQSDFKGLCFKLLHSLGTDNKLPINLPNELESGFLQQASLPLLGAIPQPLAKEDTVLNLIGLSTDTVHHILREQLTQVLARITTNQINYLSQENQEAYLIMLDFPLKTPNGIDVIPIMIKQHKAEPMQLSKWSVSFALNLSHLGSIQATVSIYAKNIDIKVNTQQTSTLQLLNHYHKDLEEILYESGLHLREWRLQLGLEENHIDATNFRLLDIKI